MEELLQNIKNDVIVDLEDDYNEDQEAIVDVLVKHAIKAVCNRRFPFGYTEAQKLTAVEQYSDVVCSIAVYLFTKRGAEGQLQMNENGTNRVYESGGIPDSYLSVIVPYAKII